MTMVLRACVILIVAIIINKCVLNEILADNSAVYGNGGVRNPGRCRNESNNNVKVINGTPAKIEDYPFMVAMRWAPATMFIPLGSGSIIGTVWILTAAHLFVALDHNITDAQLAEGVVLAYSNSTDVHDETVEVRQVIAYYNHHRYDAFTRDYDISLAKVDRKFDGLYEKPVAFAGPDYYYRAFKSARVLGFVETFWCEPLKEIKVYIAPQKSCERISFGNMNKVSNRQVCVYGWLQGPFAFDGPLYQRGRIIATLTYWKKTRDTNSSISISTFTKISKFNGFIQRTMNGIH